MKKNKNKVNEKKNIEFYNSLCFLTKMKDFSLFWSVEATILKETL
jgi:hypothetical protein